MMNHRKRSGFTLFELLVVLSVMSVVSTIGVTAYSRVTGVWRVSALRMEMASNAEYIFETIRRDIENVPSSLRTGQAIRGTDVLNEEVNYRRVPLDNDTLVLPVLQVGGKGLSERIAVKYHIQRNGTDHVLARTAGPMGGSDPNGSSLMVSDVNRANVLSMDIQYLSAGVWQPVWSGPTHPEAVRVALTLAGKGQREVEQITRSAVFPIRVK